MSKRKHDEANNTTSLEAPELFESKPIHDRSSVFIAIFTPSTSSPRDIQRHEPFESAMHKILAWRKPSAQRSLAGSFNSSSSGAAKSSNDDSSHRIVYETNSDEDGEKYAGKKLEKVLTEMDVQGTVVVARWYGGVMLGPVRFKWIEDSAREAILKWKVSVGQHVKRDEGQEVKKVKVDEMSQEEETKQKEGLIRVLQQRDASVDVLRGLLAEKNLELKRKEAGDTGTADTVDTGKPEKPAKNSSAAVPDYSSMPLQRLKQMEKARDASLSWILKQIDSVEEKIKVIIEGKDEG